MSKVLQCEGDAGWVILCPACGHGHLFDKRWSFNGNVEAPTFQPSMLARSKDENLKDTVCHSFVTDGKIQFLGDCTHDLKNQTVPLEDFPKEWVK